MLYLLNTSLIPPGFTGMALIRDISILEATALLKYGNDGWRSAVGHEASAAVMSRLLGVDVPFNREAISVKKGDMILAFQLLERLPEGVVLSEEELSQLSYSLRLLMFY